jgi:hypothetical protein
MADDNEEPRPNDRWEIVKVLEDLEEANLAVGFLQANGIAAEVESLQSSELPTHVGRLGEVRLLVPAGQTAEALALLEQAAAASPPPAEPG